MKKHKIIRSILIIVAVFVVSVIFFSARQNRTEETETVESSGPTLPVACMMINETKVNEMFAVRQTLSEQELRDSVTPIPQNKELTLFIDTKGMNIEGISYQITTPMDESVVENGQIRGYDSTETQITADFKVQSELRTGQEYTLRFTVDIGESTPLYFYTRVVQDSGIDMSGYFEFADNFVNLCLNKLEADSLSSYLETDDTTTTGSYTDVDIYSSQDDVSWGDLSPTLVKQPVPKIIQVNSTTASLSLRYLISAQDSNDQTEYYLVDDYFRLRYDNQGSVVLLDFQRSATYIFDGSHSVLSSNGLNLGVQYKDVNYTANEDQTLAAFELNGDLWTYDSESGKITRIFTFRADDTEGSDDAEKDDRTQLTEHGITIGKVTDAGDVTFVVYGYMASGSHEGYMGVSVCQYSADTNTVQELLFVPLGQTQAMLMKNISMLSYVSDDQYLYLYLGTEVCRISLTTGNYEIVKDGIPEGGFAASNSQQTIAWIDQDENGNTTGVEIMDLTTGTRYTLNKPADEDIEICGFINEDLVYGLVRSEDVGTDSSGNAVRGMYQLTIISKDGTVQKQYEPDEGVVISVTQETDGLELQLAQKTGDTYTNTSLDYIKNNELSSDMITLDTATYDRTKMIVFMVFPQTGTTLPDVQEVLADMRYTSVGSETVISWPDTETIDSGYFVFENGKMTEHVNSASAAILDAEEGHGFVLTADQRVFWVRADWADSYTIDTSSIPAAVLSCGFDADALQTAVGDDYTVLDLTGVTQDDLFYFLSRGYPVIAVGDDDSTLVIVGYDEYNIWVYDADTGEPYAIATDDSQEEFENNGSRFLTYIAN